MAKVIKIKGDASTIESDFEEAPPGLYLAKVSEVEKKVAESSGNPMVQVVWTVTKQGDGSKLKGSYGRIWYYAPVDISKVGTNDGEVRPGYARRLKELLVAFGLPLKGADIGKIEGKEALIRLKEDTNQDGDYRPRITKVLKKGSTSEAPADDEYESGEDESDEDEETYTEDELKELSNADLRSVAEELEVETPTKLTVKSKPRLIAAILEAQGGEDEGEEEEDEGEDEEEVDLDELSRAELKALIKEQELDIKVLKKDSDDDLREKVREALGEESEEEDEEEDDEDEGDNYDEMSVADLRQECEDRELDSKGSKKLLITRLRKDDQSDPV